MLFNFLNFSQCVCLGIKNIYKVTDLKVHSKGRHFVLKKEISFQEIQRTARLDYSIVFWLL